jgi:hypothetical protein
MPLAKRTGILKEKLVGSITMYDKTQNVRNHNFGSKQDQTTIYSHIIPTNKNKLRGFSPRANYSDPAPTACRRS